jgi:hypothetical protein
VSLKHPEWTSPAPIQTAPQAEHTEVPLLLWCPLEGGWHTGVWFEDRWLDSVSLDVELHPTHWLSCPEARAEHLRSSAPTATSAR